ncbi:N-terminal glutamine amidase-domain-containing protein [Crucibulum laeve]|uniref:Protein N-terminal glutamine amidohydrolase n=1 Tax=Crucibulum laeve TaxID=68775 RepID=A0A5C3MEX6_9AGAR|nr:N-terminal glutamine amidase-domain-containing protein [Crucibulum laeve]
MTSSSLPPVFPPNSVYTSCWCEENIYLLCKAFLDQSQIVKIWEVFVVFISNDSKTVALLNQKAARSDDSVVVWDYHVILVLRQRDSSSGVNPQEHESDQTWGQSWVYDLDTRLTMPCTWGEYQEHTFPKAIQAQCHGYHSIFRVIPGETYVNYFASDRSHMLVSRDIDLQDDPVKQIYLSPPPLYGPICGKRAAENGITNNLMTSFISMSGPGVTYGDVLDLKGIHAIFKDSSR